MASISAVESDDIFSSCSRKADATPVLGAIHTYISEVFGMPKEPLLDEGHCRTEQLRSCCRDNRVDTRTNALRELEGIYHVHDAQDNS